MEYIISASSSARKSRKLFYPLRFKTNVDKILSLAADVKVVTKVCMGLSCNSSSVKSKFKFQAFPDCLDRKTNLSVGFLGEVMAQ